MADYESLASLLEKEALQVAARRGRSRRDDPAPATRSLEGERDRALQRVAELEKALRDQPQPQQLEEARAALEQATRRADRLQVRIEELEAAVPQTRSRVDELEQQLGAEQERARQLELSLEEASLRAEKLEAATPEADTRLAELERQLQEALTAQERVQGLELALEDARRALESEAERAEQVRRSHGEELQAAQARVAELEHLVQELSARPAPAPADPQLERMAYEDRLTGLPNGNLLAQFLRHSLAAQGQERKAVGVVVLDFDHFKRINDRFGPDLGDKLLQRAGSLLRQGLPGEIVVGRRGEDEFTLVLATPDRGEVALGGQLHRLCLQVGQIMKGLGEVDGQSVGLTATLGVSTMYTAGSDPDQLVKQAETALYRGKELGRNRVQVYDASLHAQVQRRRERQHQFYEACQQGKVVPRFRSLVGLERGKIIGTEVVLEWRGNPIVRGAELDELVEQCGLTSYLGDWMLEQACAAARVLGRERHVVVRLFPGHMLKPDFAERTLKSVSQAGIEPSQLCLEPNPEDFAFDPVRFKDSVDSLIRWGVGLVCSDISVFLGTDCWFKVSRCYLRISEPIVSQTPDGEPGAGLCAGLVRLADRSGVLALADGVTDGEQAGFLKLLQCTAAMGNLFGEFSDPSDLLSLG